MTIEEKIQIKKELIFLMIKLCIFLSLLVISFTMIFGITRSNDNSMSPAYKNGDLAIFYRLQKDYQATDTVVVKKGDKTQIRRIIAKEGDTVDITEEGLKINGYLQQEQDIYRETLPYVDGIKFPIILGKDEYFVLGDNRPNAEDSRMYGTVTKKEIKGIVMTMIRRRDF